MKHVLVQDNMANKILKLFLFEVTDVVNHIFVLFIFPSEGIFPYKCRHMHMTSFVNILQVSIRPPYHAINILLL